MTAVCNDDDDGCANHSKACLKPTVRALAADIDALENHIEKYGSVVAKQPDVWGQARLTLHRQEFEQQMAAELTTFSSTLQGSVSGSDQAYLADAFALSAAASGGSPIAVGGGSPSATSSKGKGISLNINTAPAAAASPSSSSSGSSAISPAPLPDQSDTFGAFSGISRTGVVMPTPLQFAAGKTGIVLEPTVQLDQKARYLNHLHELRRMNEGDDTADSPGYALNLVRLPISILPGKCTEVGHGAEITMTLTPYLSDDLLPKTFRNLLINDLVDQLGLPLAIYLNQADNRAFVDDSVAIDFGNIVELLGDFRNPDDTSVNLETLESLRWKPSLEKVFAKPELAPVANAIDKLLKAYQEEKKEYKQQIDALEKSLHAYKDAEATAKTGLEDEVSASLTHLAETVSKKQATSAMPQLRSEVLTSQIDKSIPPKAIANAAASKLWTMHNRHSVDPIIAQLKGSIAALSIIDLPDSKMRRAQSPFTPSQAVDVYGPSSLYQVALAVYRSLGRSVLSKPCIDSPQLYLHLPDVQGYIQEELNSAYNFLEQPECQDLWYNHCTAGLAQAIRLHHNDHVATLRKQFLEAARRKPNGNADRKIQPVTEALLWATIVEGALLTDQLVKDMKDTATAKGCACSHEGWLDYFSPHPSQEAIQAFNEYVRCRWPIHVFALDPAAQQQNLADTFSVRREMQLAMSLAFVSGQINAQNMMRFARRVEFDFATIDLNSTDVGFSHGEETFGWRFYPRFQTPDVESNATVIARDLIVGGPSRDALLKQRRLEPGIRECVAVVIMPSFVPYATLTTSSNWFKLTNPKCKLMDSVDAVKLGKRVKTIQNCAPKITDADCYRDGDFMRLLEKAKQLETRLPLQSTMVQIPYEDTIGGFAMFNKGITNLAPELTGWYGSPSINPKDSTTLFLTGNHFSVFGTRVIAGGQYVSNVEMLSRQVLKVVIPANTILLGDATEKFVDVHIATPYGVTQHLPIPVCSQPAADGMTATAGAGMAGANQAKGVQWKVPTASLAFTYAGTSITPPTQSTDPKMAPTSLIILPGDVDANRYSYADIALKFDKSLGIQVPTFTSVPYDSVQKGYVISADDFSKAIFLAFGSKFGPETTNPPSPLVSISTTVTFKPDPSLLPAPGGKPLAVLEKNTVNNLTIQWIKAPSPAGAGAKTGQ